MGLGLFGVGAVVQWCSGPPEVNHLDEKSPFGLSRDRVPPDVLSRIFPSCVPFTDLPVEYGSVTGCGSVAPWRALMAPDANESETAHMPPPGVPSQKQRCCFESLFRCALVRASDQESWFVRFVGIRVPGETPPVFVSEVANPADMNRGIPQALRSTHYVSDRQVDHFHVARRVTRMRRYSGERRGNGRRSG